MVIAIAASNGWEIHHLDTKTAFLHGEVEEDVHVTQPEGFVVAGKEEKVYRLRKALYGLRQARRAWNVKLNGILQELGFTRCPKEPSLYRKEERKGVLIVVVYVDDLLVTCSSYLRGTTSLCFHYSRSRKQEIRGYSDSSYNVDIDDGRSTHGHVFYLNESPITWCSHKQEIVALSSCEAEFMAATEAAKQIVWVQELLSEVFGRDTVKVAIRFDNKSAIALTKNHVFHGRSKHIHRRFHFIRECVESEQIEVKHIPGTEQKADILTKSLEKLKFKEMRSLIGV